MGPVWTKTKEVWTPQKSVDECSGIVTKRTVTGLLYASNENSDRWVR